MKQNGVDHWYLISRLLFELSPPLSSENSENSLLHHIRLTMIQGRGLESSWCSLALSLSARKSIEDHCPLMCLFLNLSSIESTFEWSRPWSLMILVLKSLVSADSYLLCVCIFRGDLMSFVESLISIDLILSGPELLNGRQITEP